MQHGRTPNGLRKVELTTNTGQINTVHVGGSGTLREALGDIWEASRIDDSRIATAYWSGVSTITARCGDEVEVFERTPDEWLQAPVGGPKQ